MSDNNDLCEVVAAATIEGLAVFGNSEVTSVYVCTLSGIYAGPAAPIVCGSAAIATAVGKWANTPAGRLLMDEAAKHGCSVVVKGGEILLVEGKRTTKTFKKAAREAERTYRALNTEDGIYWLINYLSGR